MATYILQNSAQQIDQAVSAAYPALVVGGTGLVRNTGEQTISGVKTFADQVVFSSGVSSSGPSQISNVQSLAPSGNKTIDFGSQANQWKTGWFDAVSGANGVFQNVTVLGSLNASIPAPVLNNSTGNNVTLSGVTNINSANVSGALNVAGASVFSGNLSVTGNSIFNGTINATGNKTFSGNLSQSGNSSFFGNFSHSGALASTGTWSHTGVLNQTGASFFKGAVSIDSTDAVTTISGSNSQFNVITNFGVSGVTNITGSCNISGAQHALNGNLIHTGAFNHSGATILIGETRNTGDFTVVGTSVFSGHISAPSGIAASGNSSSPCLLLNRNLTSNASGGAIEYGNDGRFYLTNEITGSPNRLLLNPTYSYVAPQPFFVGNGTSGTINPLLGSTGIYLNTGTYHIYFNTKLTKGATARPIDLGITGSASNFTNRFGLVEKRHYTNSYPSIGFSLNITGSNPVSAVFGSGVNVAESLTISLDGGEARLLNNFVFDCVVTITGLTKVRPYFRFVDNVTAEAVTGTQFNMQITQLTTGTGFGLLSASGPWSDS